MHIGEKHFQCEICGIWNVTYWQLTYPLRDLYSYRLTKTTSQMTHVNTNMRETIPLLAVKQAFF